MYVICVRTVCLFLFALLLHSGSHVESTEDLYKCMNPNTGKLVNSNIKDMRKINIKIPGAKMGVDKYICTSITLPPETNYVVQFEANASASAAHHILLFGCASPLQIGGIWSCGSICKKGTPSILFAWAKNAESTVLPCDVAFCIGKSSNIISLVMQVHYAAKPESNQPLDHSGLTLYVTKEKQKYSAGIFLLDSYSGVIPANKPAYNINMSCKVNISGSIYPFAYRTHAHGLGVVISGYKFNGTWTLIGKGNPQWPQAFYPVEKIVEIKKNDVLVGRCTYNSVGHNRKTVMGPKHTDEMCNFYMMYYSDSSKNLSSYMECIDNQVSRVSQHIPADSAKPLPPNPLLEAKASMTILHPHTGSSTLNAKPPNVKQEMIYDPSWPDKNAVTLGFVSGITVDPSGNVHIFHRGPRIWNIQSFNRSNIFQDQDKPITVPTIVVFDRKGKLVKQWGANMFFMPHGITADHNGSIWITDVALHQVFRFPSGETKPDLELGERFRPGNDNQHFCKPADVAVMSDGQFFVADGYCNTRILKFSKDGTFLKKWGYSNGAVGADGFPGPGVFFVVHSVTVAEDKGLVCASDRENGRIQCFDVNGNFRQQIHLKEFGYELYALDYCPQHGGVLFAVNGPQNQTSKPCKVFIINIHSGNLISSWLCPKGMDFPHDISVDSVSHSAYIGDLLAHTAWKLQMVSVNLTGTFSKKNHIGQPSVGQSNSQLEENPNKADFQVSVLIGSLLIAPMFLIIIITVFVRYCNSAKLKCCDHRGGSLIGRQHKSFFGNFLTDRHKGFNPVNTEDSDHEIDPLTLSDDEEDYYRIPTKSRT